MKDFRQLHLNRARPSRRFLESWPAIPMDYWCTCDSERFRLKWTAFEPAVRKISPRNPFEQVLEGWNRSSSVLVGDLSRLHLSNNIKIVTYDFKVVFLSIRLKLMTYCVYNDALRRWICCWVVGSWHRQQLHVVDDPNQAKDDQRRQGRHWCSRE